MDLPNKLIKEKKIFKQEKRELPEDEFIDRKKYEKKPNKKSEKPQKPCTLKIKSASHLFEYILRVKFSDDSVKRIDFKKDIFMKQSKNPLSTTLKSISYFKKFRVSEDGVLKWPNEFFLDGPYINEMSMVNRFSWHTVDDPICKWLKEEKNIEKVYKLMQKEIDGEPISPLTKSIIEIAKGLEELGLIDKETYEKIIEKHEEK